MPVVVPSTPSYYGQLRKPGFAPPITVEGTTPSGTGGGPGGGSSAPSGWNRVFSGTIQGTYGSGSATGFGPVVFGVPHGFAGEIVFNGTSTSLYVPTQEGDQGVTRLDSLRSQPSLIFTNWARANNQQYNNVRQVAVGNNGTYDVVACGNSIANGIQVFRGDTMDTLFEVSPGGTANHAIEVSPDGAWVFVTTDSNPGTLVCYYVPSGGSTSFTVTFSGQNWDLENGGSPVYHLHCDPSISNKHLVLSSYAAGTIVLLDYSPLYGGTPSAPTVAATISKSGFFAWPLSARLYVCDTNTFTVSTYNISTYGSPSPIGGSSTYTTTHAGAVSWTQLCIDRVNHLLYLPWGVYSAQVAGWDVLAINTGTDALTLLGTIAPDTQSGFTTTPFDARVSPDGTLLAWATGEEATGNVAMWDVTSFHSSQTATLLFQYVTNFETRGGFIDTNDATPTIHTGGRYSLIDVAAEGGNAGKPVGALMPGFLTGDDFHPFGTTAAGTLQGYGFCASRGTGEDVVVTVSGGKITAVQDLSDSVFLASYWDGTYLYTIQKHAFFAVQVVVYSVTESSGIFTLTQVDQYTTSSGPAGNSAILPIGVWNTPGAEIWFASSNMGVMVLDSSVGGSMTPKTVGDIPDPIFYTITGSVTVSQATGGDSNNTGMYARFRINFYNAFNSFIGQSALSTAVQLTGANTAWSINFSGLSVPPTASYYNLSGQWSFDGTNYFGEIIFNDWINQPLTPTTIKYIDEIKVQSGSTAPSAGEMFPVAGGMMNIVTAKNRVYVSQGDLGIRIYNATSKVLTNQLTESGFKGFPGISIANPGELPGLYGGICWLVAMDYNSITGNENGWWAWSLTANPDFPPGTNQSAGGFSIRAFDAYNMVVAFNLEGPEGWTFT